jgi:hypothetical protein
MIVLVKVLLAHLAGDFLLQPRTWVEAKEKKRLGAWQLYAHTLLHGVLAALLVYKKDFLLWALLLAIIHLVIDASKLLVQKNSNRRAWFFIDQSAHLVSLYGIWWWYSGAVFSTSNIGSTLTNDAWLLITTVIFLTKPCSFAIKIFISKWTPFTEEGTDGSLQNAGKYIGMIERLFVFGFVIAGQWEAIGFLITAKSVFRFGDLKEAKDRKLTEYILIGTLASFGLAILAAVIYLKLNI